MIKEKKILELAYGLPTFYGAFKEWEDECRELWQSWNDNTLELYTGFIEEHIAANLRDHNYRPIDSFGPEEFEDLLDRLGQTYDAKTVQKDRLLIRTVTTVASNHCVYDHEIIAKTTAQKRKYAKGEKKRPEGVIAVPPRSLNMMQEILVERYLDSRIHESGAAAGLWLMFHCGLRNGEACGAYFDMIKPMEDHPEASVIDIVISTASGTSRLQINGKTYNSGRSICLSDDMVALLRSLRAEREHKLREKGLEIPKLLPIACSDSDVTKNCSAAALTKAAREMFIAVGMRRDELSALAKELWKAYATAELELMIAEYGLIEKEPTAYLLRRNFATTLEKLNMTREEKEYLMGHRIEDESTKRSDYLDEKLLWPMYQKLLQRPRLDQPEDVVTLNDTVYRGTLRGRTALFIPAEADRIKLSIRALEPDVPVSIEIDGDGTTEAEFLTIWEKMPSVPSQAVYVDNLMRRVYQKTLHEIDPVHKK